DISALALDEKIMLLEGESTWHTNGLSGKVKRMRLMDGPQGFKKVFVNAGESVLHHVIQNLWVA
ncbi:MAG: hypothetical protein J6Q69_02575, partial [Clostridia bacterium]|nr:hypothetical protein [Clostridia bacterium]